MMDAFIACWHTKYKWWTVRPITVIRERHDPGFLSHLITPPFPSYVSGHATASAAAEVVLAHFFPERADWLRAQAEEAAESRLLGGIHYRSDNEAGLELGREVGRRAVQRVFGQSPANQ
jgi:membrane-associated phospholipid phosphatase